MSASLNICRWGAAVLAVAWSIASYAATLDSDKQAALEPMSSPDGKSSTPNYTNTASIQAGTSDTKATLSLGGFVPSPVQWIDYLRVALGGDAPVSKGSTSDTDIGSVSGLTAGASANASVSAFWWPHQPKTDTDAARDICIDAIPKLIQGFTYANISASHQVVGCGSSLFDVKMLKTIAAGFTETQEQCADYKKQGKKPPTKAVFDSKGNYPATQADCANLSGAPSEAVLTAKGTDLVYLQSVGRRLHAINDKSSNVTVLTLGTTANRQKVAFFNKNDLTTLINDHSTAYGVNLALSLVRARYMLYGGLSYEKTFKTATATQICSPVSKSTSLKCQTGTIGDPPGQFSRIAFLEDRVLLLANALAISPRLEYDFTASKLGIKLPVYFAPDKDKALTGGITFGYVTHGEGFGVSVFVGKAFSFY